MFIILNNFGGDGASVELDKTNDLDTLRLYAYTIYINFIYSIIRIISNY